MRHTFAHWIFCMAERDNKLKEKEEERDEAGISVIWFYEYVVIHTFEVNNEASKSFFMLSVCWQLILELPIGEIVIPLIHQPEQQIKNQKPMNSKKIYKTKCIERKMKKQAKIYWNHRYISNSFQWVNMAKIHR